MIAYGASKAALNHFTATAALALITDNIRVNAVAPGFVRTPRVDTVAPAIQAEMLRNLPLGRAGEPEEIAALVTFLLSDASSYVNGQVVTASGAP
jgi:NAD(P)-dependent dehydrogenase (short-subunit alcohol dehydrogenase family)